MQFKNLGNSGLKVSVAGLGCNNFGAKCDQKETSAIVHKAIDLGLTLFDTANMYSKGESEKLLGTALKDKRQDVIVATKFRVPMGDGPYDGGASRRHIMTAVEDSLTRLKTDYIDLYQIHFPDDETPIEETLDALNDLVHAGKVRYIGCSNFAGWQLVEANRIAAEEGLTKFISAQNHYSLLERKIESELVPAAKAYGVGILPYFPLACGMLTGKYKRGEAKPNNSRLALRENLGDMFATEENFDITEKLTAFAGERDKSLLDLAIAWLASQTYIGSVIAGATSPEQIEANVAAANWVLTQEELDEVSLMSFKGL
jgi:aryl-alcohol dehydrogenase-like predicted oxidoreductase